MVETSSSKIENRKSKIPPRAKFIPDLVEEHYEELDYLWCRRVALLAGQSSRADELTDLDDRLAARKDGVLVAGEGLLGLLPGRLARETEGEVFAAAWPLLCLKRADAAGLVVDALATAQGPARAGLLAALVQGPIDQAGERLTALVSSGPPATSAAAARALVAHGQRVDPARLAALAADPDAQARAWAWEAIAGLPR